MSGDLSVPLILALLIGHFVADFLAQSDWMAINKSKRWGALAVHVAAYTVALFAIARLYVDSMWLRAFHTPSMSFWTFIGVNAAAHFATDAVTSRVTSRLWFFEMKPCIWTYAPFMRPARDERIVNPWVSLDGKRHWFFVAIGADQLIHFVTLMVTASWWLR